SEEEIGEARIFPSSGKLQREATGPSLRTGSDHIYSRYLHRTDRFHLVRLCSRSPSGRKRQRYHSFGTELRRGTDRSHPSTRTISSPDPRKREPHDKCASDI